MTDLAPLGDRQLERRQQMLVRLIGQLEEASVDAGLLALVANTQTTLQAFDDETAKTGE
jgi:hypothetical protein